MGKADAALAKRAKGKMKGNAGKPRKKASADLTAPEFDTSEAGHRALALVFYTEPGFGKTSTAAYASDPKLIMGAGETGYETLLAHDRVPVIPRLIVQDWQMLMATLRKLAREGADCKVLAIDTLGSVERLCHEYVCNKHFDGDWSERGFLGYQRGYVQAVNDWLMMLGLLDQIKEAGTSILMLGHANVKKTRDPLSPEYDQSILDLDKRTLSPTRRWADAILFGHFRSSVDNEGKPRDDQARVIFTENHAAHIAKNRLGMPPEIILSDDPSENWSIIRDAILSKGEE